jgi:hypothetical protein
MLDAQLEHRPSTLSVEDDESIASGDESPLVHLILSRTATGSSARWGG